MPIYGAGRIGVAYYQSNAFVFHYELADHLGNVRAVIARDQNTNLKVIKSYSDYYPYGWELPGRSYVSSENYRYGFQGQYAEKDPETNWSSFELRSYDGRVGRWMTIDPMEEFWSPYVAFGNRPHQLTDPTGGSTDWHYDNAGNLVADAGDNALTLQTFLGDQGYDLSFDQVNDVFTNLGNWGGGDLSDGIVDPAGLTLSVPSFDRSFANSGMVSGIGSSATMLGAATGIVGELSYSARMGTYFANGQIKPIREFFTRSTVYQNEVALARSYSGMAKVTGNAFALVAYFSTGADYVNSWNRAGGYPGHGVTTRTVADVGVNTAGVVGGIPGIGLNIGWELGRAVSGTDGWQNIKHNYILRTPGGVDGLRGTPR